MALSTFQGPIRSMGGSYNQGPESVVALTADTTINPTDHAGKLILINNSTLTITLPAVNAAAFAVHSVPVVDFAEQRLSIV